MDMYADDVVLLYHINHPLSLLIY